VAWLSIAAQDRAIRRDWPFCTILAGADVGLWRGKVTALSADYEVSIVYVLQPEQDGFEYDHAWFPEVRVLSPPIARRPEDPGKPIPHVYREGLDSHPILCLFDPLERGWWPDQLIAATILPLVADWLRFYEAWRATGVWTGGGREHGDGPIMNSPPVSTSPRPDHRLLADRAGLASSRLVLASRIKEGQPPYRSQLKDLQRLLEPLGRTDERPRFPALARAA
jgi:hypothetical protein